MRYTPESAVAPGPGRSPTMLTEMLVVAGTQNTDASFTLAGVPIVSAPAGAPVSVIVRHAEPPPPAPLGPKQPENPEMPFGGGLP